MTKTIKLELVYDPSKEEPNENYHTVLIAQGATVHLISIPTQMAEYMPPWSIWTIKDEKEGAMQSSEILAEAEVDAKKQELSFVYPPHVDNV